MTYILNLSGNVITLYDERKPAFPVKNKPKAGRHNVTLQNHDKAPGGGRYSTRFNAIEKAGKLLAARQRDSGE